MVHQIERLVSQTKSITVRVKSSKQLQVSTLKNNCSLFSRLYIASQICNSDLDEFFQHENQACLPELSQMGVLRTGTESYLLSFLQDLTPVNENASSPTVQVIILDGAAILNMLQHGTANYKTFHTDVFFRHHLAYLKA